MFTMTLELPDCGGVMGCVEGKAVTRLITKEITGWGPVNTSPREGTAATNHELLTRSAATAGM